MDSLFSVFSVLLPEEMTGKTVISISCTGAIPVRRKTIPVSVFLLSMNKVKADLEALLGRRVDLADINGLNEIGKKYILPEVQYVQ